MMELKRQSNIAASSMFSISTKDLSKSAIGPMVLYPVVTIHHLARRTVPLELRDRTNLGFFGQTPLQVVGQHVEVFCQLSDKLDELVRILHRHISCQIMNSIVSDQTHFLRRK